MYLLQQHGFRELAAWPSLLRDVYAAVKTNPKHSGPLPVRGAFSNKAWNVNIAVWQFSVMASHARQAHLHKVLRNIAAAAFVISYNKLIKTIPQIPEDRKSNYVKLSEEELQFFESDDARIELNSLVSMYPCEIPDDPLKGASPPHPPNDHADNTLMNVDDVDDAEHVGHGNTQSFQELSPQSGIEAQIREVQDAESDERMIVDDHLIHTPPGHAFSEFVTDTACPVDHDKDGVEPLVEQPGEDPVQDVVVSGPEEVDVPLIAIANNVDAANGGARNTTGLVEEERAQQSVAVSAGTDLTGKMSFCIDEVDAVTNTADTYPISNAKGVIEDGERQKDTEVGNCDAETSKEIEDDKDVQVVGEEVVEKEEQEVAENEVAGEEEDEVAEEEEDEVAEEGEDEVAKEDDDEEEDKEETESAQSQKKKHKQKSKCTFKSSALPTLQDTTKTKKIVFPSGWIRDVLGNSYKWEPMFYISSLILVVN
ncbi:hypothetical protein PQX77_015986 [Marasmius sp. AFHP31]|nr:hypothetical protein PQX77_015986 [Marasmius sp. AFHP31]